MLQTLTILTYHRVLPAEACLGYPFPSLAMPADHFTRQLEWLRDRAELLPLAEALAAQDRPRTRPLIALTFDDGYRDNYEIVAPLLESHGLRATFFVSSGFVAGEPMWYDRAAAQLCPVAPSAHAVAARVEELKRLPMAERLRNLAGPGEAVDRLPPDPRFRGMTPAQVADLAKRGHEIGSHTVSHEILPLADDVELRRELVDSRRTLEQWTGAPVRGFCYPNGSHDERVAAAVREAGYAYACTTLPPGRAPSDDPFRLARRDLTPSRVSTASGAFSLTSFRAELAGLQEALRT